MKCPVCPSVHFSMRPKSMTAYHISRHIAKRTRENAIVWLMKAYKRWEFFSSKKTETLYPGWRLRAWVKEIGAK